VHRVGVLVLAIAFAPLACSSSTTPIEPADAIASDANDAGFQGDPCKPSIAAGANASVVVGQGQLSYEPITDDETLTWEKGPQGGHHVWVALRMIDLRLHGTITEVMLEDVEDPTNPQLLEDSRVIFDYSPDDDGHCELPGLRSQLDGAGAEPLATVLGHHVLITATLTDPDGAVATATQTIIVTGDLD
jgi:hypothetical protein